MTEDTMQVELKQSATIEHNDSDRIYTQVEQEEMAKGWKPDGRKSAEEYRQYREDYNNSLERLKAELKEQKQSVDYLVKQNARIAQEGYERALQTLKKEQEDAALIGDVQTVSRITEQLVDLQKNNQQQPASLDFDPNPYLEFMERHKSWYVTPDKTTASANMIAMSRYADRKEEEIRLMNPNLSVPEVLDILERDLKNAFPTSMVSGAGSSAPSVVGKSQHSSRSSDMVFDDLPEFHKQMIMEHRKGTKNFNEKAYISALNLTHK